MFDVNGYTTDVEDLVVTLMACVIGLENLPNDGVIMEDQYRKAARLASELAWNTIPGGSQLEGEETGMCLGWKIMGQTDEGSSKIIERLKRRGVTS